MVIAMNRYRFEVRHCHNGHLEGVRTSLLEALEYAHGYRDAIGGSFFIIDNALPETPGDDRIVWQDAIVGPAPAAIQYLHANASPF
jgi:hypothetical protein